MIWMVILMVFKIKVPNWGFHFKAELRRCVLVLMLWGTPSAWPVYEARKHAKFICRQHSMKSHTVGLCIKRVPVLHIIICLQEPLMCNKSKTKTVESGSKSFSECLHLLVLWHLRTWVLCYLFGSGALAFSEGALCTHCDKFSVIKFHSLLALFLRGEGQVSAPCSSGPAAAKALLPAPVMCWIQKLDHLDLHSEVEKSWKNPYLAHIFPFQHLNYMKGGTVWARICEDTPCRRDGS